MGIFKQKPVYKCKMLEPYRVDIDTILLQGKFKYDNYCKKVAETEEYCFYSYNTFSDQSGGYVLRRSKDKPKNIVFFGENCQLNCVYRNHLFQVNHHGSIGGQFFIICKNIRTGETIKFDWFGKGCVLTHHLFCQDTVDTMQVENGKLVLSVHRTKANYYSYPEERVANSKYDFDTDYKLIVDFENGKFKATAVFPPRVNNESPIQDDEENETKLNESMQCTGMDFILSQDFSTITEMKEHSYTDTYSCIEAVVNGRPSVIYIETMMYPQDFNRVISSKVAAIEEWADEKFSDNIDIYALGIGLINKKASEEQKGIYKIGEKYSVAVGNFLLIKTASFDEYGLSKNSPITLSMVSDEYFYLDHLCPKIGDIVDCRRIGSFSYEDNPHTIDKWEVTTVVKDIFDIAFKYYLYMDAYELDFVRVKIEDIKKTPIYFDWNEQ